MGLERVMVSSKLSVENTEFLEELARRMRPYEVSQSSLMNTLVRIVRHLEATGKISLEPTALQELMRTDGSEGLPGVPKRKAR